MPGRFVVLEGGDGSGKSTQAARLAAGLRDRGASVCETFEPGATPAGAVIRELLLHRRETIAPTTEALLMAADRAQHVAEQIAPALGTGRLGRVRPLPAFVARLSRDGPGHRGGGSRGAESGGDRRHRARPRDRHRRATTPIAQARAGDSPDRLEAEGADFHAAVRAAYRTLAAERGWAVVDGERRHRHGGRAGLGARRAAAGKMTPVTSQKWDRRRRPGPSGCAPAARRRAPRPHVPARRPARVGYRRGGAMLRGGGHRT